MSSSSLEWIEVGEFKDRHEIKSSPRSLPEQPGHNLGFDADEMFTRAEIEVHCAIHTQWGGREGGEVEYLKGKKLYGPLQLHRIYPVQKSQ